MGNSSDVESSGLTNHSVTPPASAKVRVPDYLSKHYWWAYLHPNALRIFEQKWLIDAILWGNYNKLSGLALEELGENVRGRTLQIACVYGTLTPRLVERLDADAKLDVIDVAGIQLDNLAKKVDSDKLHLYCQDAADLEFEDDSFDQILVFFLLHELPLAYRKQALAEAMRVVKSDGRLIIVDYHRPVWSNPLKYLMPIVFKLLEPFAIDLWRKEIAHWLPENSCFEPIEKHTYFGGLYQKLLIRKK